ncbi:DUF2189 domain-containing protein [Pelagibacterium xiamenense]|uniref:DUF2189 domain-containing protein n=1 Tax=Pelagibacterium xiamenense TaxID=2901140 RepID=UPI001E3E8A3D|nr:DUF2189 domain-containing protein [Pelagibacterium xiamenense]MCD7060416.1 DUF2189 domain-containing protein [Pelagibacterium xiamenense]
MPALEAEHVDNATGRAEGQVDGIRSITLADVFAALKKGASDFWERPSHYIFLVIIYPIVGFVLAVWTAGGETFSLLYPIATGFALVGPIAGIGLYEISRRREQGLDDHPAYAFMVLRSPAIGSILALGLVLAVMFGLWLLAANAIYGAFFGETGPTNLPGLLAAVFTTPQGWGLLFWGNLVGFFFAFAVLASTVVAFPRLLDRGGTAADAVALSLRAVMANLVPMLAWGLIVAALLFIGSLPLFVGLAIVLPILGHATWHLYRAVVV